MKVSLRKLATEKLFNEKTNIDINTSKYYDDEIKSSNIEVKEWQDSFFESKSGISIIQKNWNRIIPDKIIVDGFEYDINNEKEILVSLSKPVEVKKRFNMYKAQDNELIIKGLNNNEYKTVLNNLGVVKVNAMNDKIIDNIGCILQNENFENICLVQKIKWE